MAGVDTTQSAINWNMLQLANNPDAQEKVRAEVLSVFGKDGPLTAEPFEKMRMRLPYLRAFVRETHRLTPASPTVTNRPCPVDLELGGYLVPKETRVNFNVWNIQNDPKYVEEPEKFMPERWLDDAVEQRRGTEAGVIDHKLLSNPFSFGARMCMGGRVAELEIYTIICHVVRTWRLEVAEDAEPWAYTQPLLSAPDPFPAFTMERV